MSRHPKGSIPNLTPEIAERLCLHIRRGAYVETACALTGVSKDTFYRWIRIAKSENATQATQELSDAVERAMAEAETRFLNVIDAAAEGGIWQAAAWRLERMFPSKWGRQGKLQVEHSGPEGRPMEIEDRRRRIQDVLNNPETFAAVASIEEHLRAKNK